MQGVKNIYYYLVIFYLLFSGLIFFLDYRDKLSFVHSGAQVLTIPVRSSLFDTRNALLSPLSVFSSSAKQNEQIRELEEKVASLSSQLADQKALEEENAKMRRLLGTNLPPNWQFAPARVVSFSGDTMAVTSDFLPSIGTPVITSQETGVWVGKVQEVVGREVRVILPTHPSSKIPVIVREAKTLNRRASGIVVGGEVQPLLDQLLASEDVKEGDVVVTSGEGGIPPELLIGTVAKVREERSNPWKQAVLTTPLDSTNLDFVFFVTKY